MADEKPEAEASAENPGPKRIMGMPLPQFLFVAINALVVLGGFGYIYWAMMVFKKPAITNEQVVKEIEKKNAKPASPAEGSETFIESYPEMTVTLRGQQGGKNNYVTVEVSLVCGSTSCVEQVKANKAKVEDAIQNAISSRSYGELGSLEVKFRVKHEILGAVNGFLKDAAVIDVLFTNFLVQ